MLLVQVKKGKFNNYTVTKERNSTEVIYFGTFVWDFFKWRS